MSVEATVTEALRKARQALYAAREHIAVHRDGEAAAIEQQCQEAIQALLEAERNPFTEAEKMAEPRICLHPEDYERRDDGKVVRKDRWEWAVRNIVTALHGPRHSFEIEDLVQEVRDLKEQRKPNVTRVQLPEGWVAIPTEPTTEQWLYAQGTLLDANWDAVTCLAARIQSLIGVSRAQWRKAMVSASNDDPHEDASGETPPPAQAPARAAAVHIGHRSKPRLDATVPPAGEWLVPLPQRMSASIYHHKDLGDLYDRLAVHMYAVGYADLCFKHWVSTAGRGEPNQDSAR